jgi:hypothetical protein
MSNDQLDEFESIIDRKDEVVRAWLQKYKPDYINDIVFIKLQKSNSFNATDSSLMAEYAATKWLEINRPDYRIVVSGVLSELKKEVSDNRDVILGASKS